MALPKLDPEIRNYLAENFNHFQDSDEFQEYRNGNEIPIVEKIKKLIETTKESLLKHTKDPEIEDLLKEDSSQNEEDPDDNPENDPQIDDPELNEMVKNAWKEEDKDNLEAAKETYNWILKNKGYDTQTWENIFEFYQQNFPEDIPQLLEKLEHICEEHGLEINSPQNLYYDIYNDLIISHEEAKEKEEIKEIYYEILENPRYGQMFWSDMVEFFHRHYPQFITEILEKIEDICEELKMRQSIAKELYTNIGLLIVQELEDDQKYKKVDTFYKSVLQNRDYGYFLWNDAFYFYHRNMSEQIPSFFETIEKQYEDDDELNDIMIPYQVIRYAKIMAHTELEPYYSKIQHYKQIIFDNIQKNPTETILLKELYNLYIQNVLPLNDTEINMILETMSELETKEPTWILEYMAFLIERGQGNKAKLIRKKIKDQFPDDTKANECLLGYTHKKVSSDEWKILAEELFNTRERRN